MRRVIRPNQLGQYELRLKANMLKMTTKVIRQSSDEAIRLIQDRIHAGRPHPPIDRGRYLRGWRLRKISDVYMSLVNVAKNAIYVEGGRRRGARRPPIGAIAPWARRKFGLTKKESRRAAFAIAQKIGRRGIRARPFGRRAIPAIAKIFQRNLERQNSRWIRGERI